MPSQRILIIEADKPAASTLEDARLLEQQVRAAGYLASRIAAPDAVNYLKKAIVAGEEPAVVILGPTVTNALLVARQLRAVWARGHLIFAPHADRLALLRRELSRAPMIGSNWSLVTQTPGMLSKQIANALQTIQKQVRLRTTLDRANLQISAPKPVDSADYRRLLLSDHYLANLLTQAQDVIVSLDASHKILYWSAGAARMFGLSPGAAVGRSLSDTKLWSGAMGDYLARVPAATQALTAELTVSTADIPRMMEVVFSAVRDDSGSFIGASMVMRDVTERMRQLETERHARTEAEQLSRLKDDFFATLSHELRTPLNSILGWTQLLQRANLSPERLSSGLATIERNALHQAKLIEDLLDISSIISGKLRLDRQPVRMGGIVESALNTVRPDVDAKRLQLTVTSDAADDLVNGDAHRLQQVMWNLLSNAVKFTPEDGAISVAVSRFGSWVQIVVADTGQGMNRDFLPHVFGRFRQADSSITRRKGGLGLGLSIVRQLVEMHQGTVSAASPGTGFGSTFTVLLPLYRTDAENDPGPGPAKAASETTASLNGMRILIVDDEPDARNLVAVLLQNNGAETMTAESAADALEVIGAFNPDLLISDIGMPGVDGYELLKLIRTRVPSCRDLPAVALTAFAGHASRDKALAAGYRHHIAKPFQAAELLAVAANLAHARKAQD